MLSKRPVLRFTAALFFLLKLLHYYSTIAFSITLKKANQLSRQKKTITKSQASTTHFYFGLKMFMIFFIFGILHLRTLRYPCANGLITLRNCAVVHLRETLAVTLTLLYPTQYTLCCYDVLKCQHFDSNCLINDPDHDIKASACFGPVQFIL